MGGAISGMMGGSDCGAPGVPLAPCRKMIAMQARRARESKCTEPAAWLRPSTLVACRLLPRPSRRPLDGRRARRHVAAEAARRRWRRTRVTPARSRIKAAQNGVVSSLQQRDACNAAQAPPSQPQESTSALAPGSAEAQSSSSETEPSPIRDDCRLLRAVRTRLIICDRVALRFPRLRARPVRGAPGAVRVPGPPPRVRGAADGRGRVIVTGGNR